MDVSYRIENDRLAANNHLFIDQLTFGERVDSPTATRLPVLLAVSLLKNSRGQIDLRLPVSGSLDDPKFSVGGIIVQRRRAHIQQHVSGGAAAAPAFSRRRAETPAAQVSGRPTDGSSAVRLPRRHAGCSLPSP